MKAPFTDEQVKIGNENQQKFGLLTCMGFQGCKRPAKHNHGLLQVKNAGCSCPCGRYIELETSDIIFGEIKDPFENFRNRKP